MFKPATLAFLEELAAHNERDWFEANKTRYEADVREPALAFIRAMAAPLTTISTHFSADDRKVGGSLMRIHRDVRFSRDKSPYKTNIGIQFKHQTGEDVHAIGFYVHVAPEDNFIGLGLWRPDPPTLRDLRQKIHDEYDRFAAILAHPDLAKARLVLEEGDPAARVPKGFDKSHPSAEYLRKTSLLLTGPLTVKALTGKALVTHVTERFAAGAPFMRFLCEALELDF
jgi:uncharacterized protein (TIGR02453 family)